MTGTLPAPPSVWSRRRFGRWALGLIAGATAPWSRMRAGEAEDYEVVVLRDQMVRMRDGVHLATDVYLPARNGKAAAQRFAVILERTPYGKTLANATDPIAGDAPIRSFSCSKNDTRVAGRPYASPGSAIDIVISEPHTLPASVLEEHQATRGRLMRECLELRQVLGLEPLDVEADKVDAA